MTNYLTACPYGKFLFDSLTQLFYIRKDCSVSKQHNFFSFLRKNMHSCMFYFWGKTGVLVHGVLTSNAFSLNLIICIKLVYVPLFYKYCHDCNFDLSTFCI